MIGVFKLENEVVSGTGKFDKSGVSSSRDARESLDTAYHYLHRTVKPLAIPLVRRRKIM